jgi:hypothetical protein
MTPVDELEQEQLSDAWDDAIRNLSGADRNLLWSDPYAICDDPRSSPLARAAAIRRRMVGRGSK